LALFHLLIHAVFKSLLFLCSGNYIHSISSLQDIRYLGLGSKADPIISCFFIYSLFSLVGWPFIAGFYSKDLILELFYIGGFSLFLVVFLGLSVLLTIFYRIRLFIHIFVLRNVKFGLLMESDRVGVYFSILILFLLTVGGGSIINGLFFPIIFCFFVLFNKGFSYDFYYYDFLLFFFCKLLFWVFEVFIFFKLIWGLVFLRTVLISRWIYLGVYLSKWLDSG